MPHTLGLLGHSDADVLTHAVMDALLGRPGWEISGGISRTQTRPTPGRDSLKLLDYVVELLEAQGWKVGNVDATILAQRLKLAPHLEQMRENLAARMKVEPDGGEREGHRGEAGLHRSGGGIASHAVCLLERV